MVGNLIPGSDTSSFDTISDNDKGYKGGPHRRIWSNPDHSRWDGLIPILDSGSSDHYICTGIDGGTPSFTGIKLEYRNSGRPTTYRDNVNKKLHCFSSHNTTSRFWTLDYDDAYTFAVGSEGAGGIEVPGMNRATNSMAMAMTKSPNNHIWVFGMDDGVLKMQRSTDEGATWETSATILALTGGSGTVDCTHFNYNGTNYVCVYAAEDSDVSSADDFFFFIDENHAAPTTAGNWTDESSSLPAFDATAEADNHVCMAVTSGGKLGIVYKTGGGSTDDDIKLVTRAADGAWTGSFEVWNDSDNMTRPVIATKKIDGANGEEFIIIAATTGGGPTIKYKTTPVDTISFSAETTIFEDTVDSDAFNDPVVYQADFVADSSSGFAVIAHNVTDEVMWYNTIAITSSGSSVSVTATAAIESRQKITTSNPVALEVKQSLSHSQPSPLESLQSIITTRPAPLESLKSTVTISATSLESLSAIITGLTARLETLQQISAGRPVAIESLGNTSAIAVARTASIECLQGLSVQRQTPIAVLRGLSRSETGSLECSATVIITGQAAIEALQGITAANSAQIEAFGRVSQSRRAAFESITTRIISRSGSLEVLTQSSRADTVSLEVLRLLEKTAATQIEAAGVTLPLTFADLEMLLTSNADINIH
jgi:hypothetical protein